MKERERTKRKKGRAQSTNEYNIDAEQDSSNYVTDNGVQDPHVPILPNEQDHANPIDQINDPTITVPTTPPIIDSNNRFINDDTTAVSNNTDDNEITAEETSNSENKHIPPKNHQTPVDDNNHDNKSINGDKTNTIKVNHAYNTRGSQGQRPQQYDKVYGAKYTFTIALTQMSANRGIEIFGQRAIDTLAMEWQQLDTLSVFKGREYESLSKDERYTALKTVQLIKEKKMVK